MGLGSMQCTAIHTTSEDGRALLRPLFLRLLFPRFAFLFFYCLPILVCGAVEGVVEIRRKISNINPETFVRILVAASGSHEYSKSAATLRGCSSCFIRSASDLASDPHPTSAEHFEESVHYSLPDFELLPL